MANARSQQSRVKWNRYLSVLDGNQAVCRGRRTNQRRVYANRSACARGLPELVALVDQFNVI